MNSLNERKKVSFYRVVNLVKLPRSGARDPVNPFELRSLL